MAIDHLLSSVLYWICLGRIMVNSSVACSESRSVCHAPIHLPVHWHCYHVYCSPDPSCTPRLANTSTVPHHMVAQYIIECGKAVRVACAPGRHPAAGRGFVRAITGETVIRPDVAGPPGAPD